MTARMWTHTSGKLLGTLIGLSSLAVATILGLSFYFSSSSIHSLLTQNHELNRAITNLTREEQIGYAVVESVSRSELGQETLIVRFVQTAAGNPKEIVDEQFFSVEGDVVHFDALIVKFTDDYVKDGRERALYLWRRIYGERTPPEQGEPIQAPGSAPERYHAISKALKVSDRGVFWEAVWDLANHPERLSQHGIQAVFGNAIYTRMEAGKVYLFKIGATGQIYPEVLDFF